MDQNSTTDSPFDADRPQRFDGIVGNQKVTKKLAAMLAKNRLPKVIYFNGPIGSGKTTTARIVARAKLCTGRSEGEYEPCGLCPHCQDVLNDSTCSVVEYHEYAAIDMTLESLTDLTFILLRPWEVVFIDELQDMAPDLLRKFRKMLESTKATVIMATTHPDQIEDAVRSRLKSYEYEITRPTVEEAAVFLETKFASHQISFESRRQLERVTEALNCEMRPIGEFPRKVIAEADGKLTDEYLDEVFGAPTVQTKNMAVRRKQLI